MLGVEAALMGGAFQFPGRVVRVNSQSDLQAYGARSQQFNNELAKAQMQSQMLQFEASLLAQQSFAGAAMAAASCTVRKRTAFYPTRERHRRRKWMRKTKAGYKARERAECALWISVGTILAGGVLLPVAIRVYTALWTWALGGG